MAKKLCLNIKARIFLARAFHRFPCQRICAYGSPTGPAHHLAHCLCSNRGRTYSAAIFSSAPQIASASTGRTSRSTSTPSRMKMSVGHSLTLNERPRRRPGPSSTLMCSTCGHAAKAKAIKGWAARQCAHHDAPNSMTRGSFKASISARAGSVAGRACEVVISAFASGFEVGV